MASNKKYRMGFLPHEKAYKIGVSGGMELNHLKVNNNDLCPCESGNKFKHCCRNKKIFIKK